MIEDELRRVVDENREYWEAIAAERLGAPIEFFRAGQSTLEPQEIAVIGDPSGLRVLHLACSVGNECLNLAMLGAHVTGVDLSPTHIANARIKAAQLNLDIDFREGDMTALEPDLTGFDLVYISGGGICWVPDIEAWAETVAARLSPNGRVVICEHHPLWECLSVAGENSLKVTSDYFGRARTGYADPLKAPQVTHGRPGPLPVSTSFIWGLGEVVSALIQAGLQLETLQEFSQPDMYSGLGSGAAKIPASYLVSARLPRS